MSEATFTTIEHAVMLPTISTPWRLYMMGDFHYGSDQCAVDQLKQDLRTMKAEKDVPVKRYVILGDETDTASTSERFSLSVAKLHDTTLEKLDRHALETNVEMRDMLSFMRGNLIAMVQGNHHWQFTRDCKRHDVTRGLSSTEWLARQLGARWAGYLSYVVIKVTAKNNTTTYRVDLVLCHGKAGGKLVGSSINQVADMRTIFPQADILCFGHDHQRSATPMVDLTCEPLPGGKDPQVRQKLHFLCRSGSYQKAYVPNDTSYVVQKVLRPASLGYVSLDLKLTRPDVGEVTGKDRRARLEMKARI